MATLARAAALLEEPRGRGWRETVLRSPGEGDCTFAAARWALDGGATTDVLECESGESVLYVIEGTGRIVLGNAEHGLAEESLVWLEPGDRYRLEAGEGGLAVLAAEAWEGAAG